MDIVFQHYQHTGNAWPHLDLKMLELIHLERM